MTTAKPHWLKRKLPSGQAYEQMSAMIGTGRLHTVCALKQKISGVQVEVLIPDFQGNWSALETVIMARPAVVNHNMETVRRLYNAVRPQASYRRSLELLARVKSIAPSVPSKSGIMLGLGETASEIRQVINDIYHTGCCMLTIGQYLQPTAKHLPVVNYIQPQRFEYWRHFALDIGFEKVASGPFVRSSYHAGIMFNNTDGVSAPSIEGPD